MTCPCRDCEKRNIGCHSKCSLYKEWAKENEKLRHERYEKTRAEYLSRPGKPVRRRRK